MKDQVLWYLLKLIPKHTLSRLVGRVAASSASKPVIPLFSKYFNIQVEEAEKSLQDYHSLTEFFTRRLHPAARPIATSTDGLSLVVSPVDGTIAQVGRIEKGVLLQAKEVKYTVEELLGAKNKFQHGSYITIYLSPKDYHRIHSPVAGQVVGYTYVPGTLFPVNALGVSKVHGLFAKNERLITYIRTSQLPHSQADVAVVKVGATIVGSVKVVYHDQLGTNVKKGKLATGTIDGPHVASGDELGWFEFGSTVVLLFEHPVDFVPQVQAGAAIRMGEPLGTLAH